MISGRMSVKSRCLIIFKLIENFNFVNCFFLCLNINMYIIVVMKGVKFLILKIKCFILIVVWKFLSIMDNVIVIMKNIKIIIVYWNLENLEFFIVCNFY